MPRFFRRLAEGVFDKEDLIRRANELADFTGDIIMSQKSVAEIIVETLVAAGVKRVYGVVGDSLNGLLEEIGKQTDIEWIHVRHEETGAFAAGAQAHLTGELAVCAGSCGPGNMHLINGLYDCHRSRVPVLAIALRGDGPLSIYDLADRHGGYPKGGRFHYIASQYTVKRIAGRHYGTELLPAFLCSIIRLKHSPGPNDSRQS